MNKALPLAALIAPLLLIGCHDDDDDIVVTPPPEPEPMMARYQITVTNLTSAQPMSPVAAYLHDGTARGWQLGQSASVGLEELAEAGDGTTWLMEAEGMGSLTSASGSDILMPGMSQSLELTLEETDTLALSLATMLVNTNDGYTGLDGLDLAALAPGEAMMRPLPVYDAGTEANSELAATIPGPAGGGAGFDSGRDDVDFVARHPGVVSQDDGVADSALRSMHRFDGPVARLVVTRME
ncbi:spondin domain-containing protein [Ferrimonas balearica]|uniref:spondin domain-containing protein n=1 Tax=Ferrimonas balearica TaxID=44012 RepID=UPI001C99A264|nr:spondin domain-containing protein [Ferrimonas balearica]MBY5992785.1 spondin domain-containing protein [Ferrimonas balearica]